MYRRNWLSILYVRLVLVAIEPALAGLGRRDHGVGARLRVLARVFVRRGIAAERPAAALTGAEVHPFGSDADALLAFTFLGQFHILDLLEMGARRGFHRSTSVPAPSGSIPPAWRRIRTSCSGTTSGPRRDSGHCEPPHRGENTRTNPCRSTQPRAGSSPP